VLSSSRSNSVDLKVEDFMVSILGGTSRGNSVDEEVGDFVVSRSRGTSVSLEVEDIRLSTSEDV